MLSEKQIERCNQVLIEGLADLLNTRPDWIDAEAIGELTGDGLLTEQEAYALLLAAGLGLSMDRSSLHREIFDAYFPELLHRLETKVYRADPYYSTVRLPAVKDGAWELRSARYQPYEAFVCNDLLWRPDGRVIPQIGYFSEAFEYPVVLEGGREWMLITPNEINTMAPAIEASYGRVLTYGLGLGYFAFMAARKSEVESVTVVEREEGVIHLFQKHILPQLGPAGEKIRVIHSDAFDYAEHEMGKGGYNFVFTDLWHDPSDGVELYRRMKALEARSPGSDFAYWIEPTLRCYME